MKIESIYGQLPTLETNRLLLRKLSLDDVEDMYEYTSNETVSRFVNWNPHKSKSETKTYIHFVLQQYFLKKIAPWGIQLKENNKLIGTIDFVSWEPAHRTAEIGYAISHLYWGKGLTSEAVHSLIHLGFTKMELERIQARCIMENLASQRVMEKNHMKYEGTLRKSMLIKGIHRDITVYSILKEEYEKLTLSKTANT